MTTLFGDDFDRKATSSKHGPEPAGVRVGVLLPVSFATVYDYLVPVDMQVPDVGAFVKVPLSGRTVTGVVWNSGDGKLPIKKLKPVTSVLIVPPLQTDLIRFVDFVARYTLATPGAVLRMVMSSPDALVPAPERTQVRFAKLPDAGFRMTPTRQKVIDAARESGSDMSVSELAESAGVSDGVVRGLADAGILSRETISMDAPYLAPNPDLPGPELRSEQSAAADVMVDALGEFSPILLEGITGSGKTEVYFELVAAALQSDPDAQVLVLVPEIALTSQWLSRFEDRFGCEPVVWHSDIGEAGRRRAWRQTAAGGAKVIVGARSALFLPFMNLTAIIVDEEHDPSFKQEEGVMYHARDMAVVRAKEAACPVVLASATPSLESRVNALKGRYKFVRLKERHGVARLPKIRAVDLRSDGPQPGQWISPPLETQVNERLERGEQAMLFLNRRGYAPLTLCRACGHRFQCPHCTSWLVEHRFQSELQCHQCGHHEPVPPACPNCKEADALVACGPGVERLFEEATKLFPTARTCIMTSDTMTRPAEMAQMVAQIAEGGVDIVIGTQIVTKGYNFPNLTLVGVIDADLGLRGGDLRAAERTYQQLTQVAGRAGRAERPGEVILQTFEPAHPVVTALTGGDVEAFLSLEQDTRERYQMPPFGKLAAVILSGENESEVMAFGRHLARIAPAMDGLSVLGPAPAPFARIRGQFRVRFLIHGKGAKGLQAVMKEWIIRAGKQGNVKVKIDIDPYSFL